MASVEEYLQARDDFAQTRRRFEEQKAKLDDCLDRLRQEFIPEMEQPKMALNRSFRRSR